MGSTGVLVEEWRAFFYTECAYLNRRKRAPPLVEHFNFPIDFRELSGPLGKQLDTDWSGGDLTSDGGLLLLVQADQQLGLSASIAGAIGDSRARGRVQFSERELALTRMITVAAGYADTNDLNALRYDPGLLISLGHRPGAGRVASQSSFSRFENRVRKTQVLRAAYVVARCAVSQLPVASKRVTIELDGSDDACHGQQELAGFNNYYKSNCFMPLLVHIMGEDGRRWLVGVALRPGRSGGAKGFPSILKRVVKLVRERCPHAEITVRCDSGFGQESHFALCDEERVNYVIGLPSNPRLDYLARSRQQQALAKYQTCKGELLRARTAEAERLAKLEPAGGRPIELDWAAKWEQNDPLDTAIAEAGSVTYGSAYYRTEKGKTVRRVAIQTKVAGGKVLTRYLVTNILPPIPEVPREGWSAQRVFDFYACRGDQENRIKEWKLDLDGGRTSCHRFVANQFRLVLHTAATLLMNALQSLLPRESPHAKLTVGSLRLHVIKVAARAIVSTRRILLQYATSFAHKALFSFLNQALLSGALQSGRAPAT